MCRDCSPEILLLKLIFLTRMRFQMNLTHTVHSRISIGTELSVYRMAVLRGLKPSIFCRFSLHPQISSPGRSQQFLRFAFQLSLVRLLSEKLFVGNKFFLPE